MKSIQSKTQRSTCEECGRTIHQKPDKSTLKRLGSSKSLRLCARCARTYLETGG